MDYGDNDIPIRTSKAIQEEFAKMAKIDYEKKHGISVTPETTVNEDGTVTVTLKDADGNYHIWHKARHAKRPVPPPLRHNAVQHYVYPYFKPPKQRLRPIKVTVFIYH
jgi:hypothetical protein